MKCNKNNNDSDHIQNDGGNKYPGVTLSTCIAVSEIDDRMYPSNVTMQMIFTVDDVFTNNAPIC